jgi:hypothetical protein
MCIDPFGVAKRIKLGGAAKSSPFSRSREKVAEGRMRASLARSFDGRWPKDSPAPDFPHLPVGIFSRSPPLSGYLSLPCDK